MNAKDSRRLSVPHLLNSQAQFILLIMYKHKNWEPLSAYFAWNIGPPGYSTNSFIFHIICSINLVFSHRLGVVVTHSLFHCSFGNRVVIGLLVIHCWQSPSAARFWTSCFLWVKQPDASIVARSLEKAAHQMVSGMEHSLILHTPFCQFIEIKGMNMLSRPPKWPGSNKTKTLSLSKEMTESSGVQK